MHPVMTRFLGLDHPLAPTAAGLCLVLGSCGGAGSPTSADRILAQLEQAPDDNRALLLALPLLDLDASRALAERSHEPTHLARVVNELARTWKDEDELCLEVVERCSSWAEVDEENGLPALVRGNAELHRGNLERALFLWQEASLEERVDDRTEDARREALDALRTHGIDDVACTALVLEPHERLRQQVVDAALGLTACAEELGHRRRLDEAWACHEAVLRLADRFERSTRDVVGLLQVAFVRGLGASGLVELAILRDDRESAERFLAVCEENGRTAGLLERSLTRAEAADPFARVTRGGLERGLEELRGESPPDAAPPRSVAGWRVRPTTGDRTRVELEERMRRHAGELRTYFETRTREGEWGLYQAYLTEEDRAQASSFRAAERGLLELPSGGTGDAQAWGRFLRDEDLRSAAVRTLIHRKDRGAVPTLRELLSESDPDSEEALQYAFGLAGLEQREPEVVRLLVASLEEPWSRCALGLRGLASLGATEHVDDILARLVTATDLDEPQERISACFALRDLTGTDLGTDPAAWSNWVEANGQGQQAQGNRPRR